MVRTDDVFMKFRFGSEALNRAIGMSRSTANVHAASAHIGRKIAA
jgi:hypothetical protein